jgi:AraC-like DNA-binding protein
MRRLIEFPLKNFPRLTHLGRAIDLESDAVADHHHLGYELVYFAEGTAEVKLHSHERLTVGPGDLLIIAPRVTHSFYRSSKRTSFSWLGYQAGHRVYVAANSNLHTGEPLQEVEVAASSPLPGAAALPVETHTLLHGAHSTGRVFRDLFEELEHNDDHSETIMALLILQLFARTSRGLQAGGGKLETLNAELISELNHFIVTHLESELTLPSLARYVGYNPSYLSRFYHAQTGKTLFQFIKDNRLERAKVLLGQGLAVTSVAEKTGFKSIHHFSTVFKQVEGVSPSRYE